MKALETFDFEKDYQLENDRVLLRPLKTTHMEFLIPYVELEPEIWAYSLMAIKEKSDLVVYIETALKAKKNKTEYPFIVYDKISKSYAGCTRFYDIQLKNKTTQLGYTWYGKKYWGSGLNHHCKYLLLQFAFDTMGFERVEFRADNENKRSIAAMQKIGCTVEGILRSHLPKPDGSRRDSIVLSILKQEWDSALKTKILSLL